MIFVVEDDPLLRRSLVEFLTIKGQPVEGFDAAEPALEAARHNLPDVGASPMPSSGSRIFSASFLKVASTCEAVGIFP